MQKEFPFKEQSCETALLKSNNEMLNFIQLQSKISLACDEALKYAVFTGVIGKNEFM